jgi:hypothetical protein
MQVAVVVNNHGSHPLYEVTTALMNDEEYKASHQFAAFRKLNDQISKFNKITAPFENGAKTFGVKRTASELEHRRQFLEVVYNYLLLILIFFFTFICNN